MATFVRPPYRSWRARVWRKSRYIGETFHQREDERRWTTTVEADTDRGARPKTTKIADKQPLPYRVDLHISDLKAPSMTLANAAQSSLVSVTLFAPRDLRVAEAADCAILTNRTSSVLHRARA